mgnify:CR=1 FL=1
MRDSRKGVNSVRSELTHNQALERLRQSENELAEAQQLASLGSWSWDIKTGRQPGAGAPAAIGDQRCSAEPDRPGLA